MTEHATPPGIGDLLWPVLNFVLFAALLVRFLRAPVIEYFRARTVRLRDALAAGARARAEAAALRESLARDVERLPEVTARLRADLRATAEREHERLLAIGRHAAERIRSDARLLGEQEFVAAREALRTQMVDEAVRQASALLRRAIGPEDQQRFVRDFLTAAGAGG